MTGVLVDTSAWFALYVPDDVDHRRAIEWYQANDQPIITTDYIVGELLTLLRFRREIQRAIKIAAELTKNLEIELVRVTAADFEKSIEVFQRFHDKLWSFTDCSSRVVMERLGITHAFAFDHDFRQFGTVTVVP